MPTYDVSDPETGRSFTLDGDSPPTEEELSEIFGTSVAQSPHAGFGNFRREVEAPEQEIQQRELSAANPFARQQFPTLFQPLDDSSLKPIAAEFPVAPPPKPKLPAAIGMKFEPPARETIAPEKKIEPTLANILAGAGMPIEEPEPPSAFTRFVHETAKAPIGLAKFEFYDDGSPHLRFITPSGEESDHPGIGVVGPFTLAISALPDGTPKRLLAGAHNAIAGFVNFFLSPQGAATAGTAKLGLTAQRAIASFFAYDMLKNSPEQLIAGADAFEKGDTGKATELWLSGAGGLVLGGLLAKHGASPGLVKDFKTDLAKLREKTKGEPNASRIEPTAEVHGDVRPLAGEGERQVPIQESGAGIQPQAEPRLPEPTRPGEVAGQVGDEIIPPVKPKEPAADGQPLTPVSGEPVPSATEQKITYANDKTPSQLRKAGVVSQLKESAQDGGDIILADGKPAGWMHVSDDGVLEAIEVKPEFQRRGIASKVVRELAEVQGSNQIKVFLPTEQGRALLESLGKLEVNEHGEGILTLGEAERASVTNKGAESLAKPLSDFDASQLGRLRLKREQGREMTEAQKSRLAELEAGTDTSSPLPPGEIETTPLDPATGSPLVKEVVGMGAATPGEPLKPELAQLTDAVKTLAESSPATDKASAAFDLGAQVEKAKDGVSQGLMGLKAAAQYLKAKLVNYPVWDSWKAALGDRHLALSESAQTARKWVKSAEKAVPNSTDQEAISNWIDTGGNPDLLALGAAETKPRYKAGYEKAQSLSPEQKTLAQNVKNYFASRLQDAIDAGVLEDGIEDYIHRTYEADSPWKQKVLAELRSGIFTGRPALAKQRVFQYDFEAERAGLKPIKSFIKRVAAYDLSLNKAIADRQAVKAMMQIKMPDGRPMIDVGGMGKKIEGESGETEATLIKRSFKPTDTETPANNRGDFKPFDHPALRKWKWATADENGKPIFVQGDVLIHPDAIKQVKTLFERSSVRQNPIGRGALALGSTVKQTMLDLSGFHPVQITVHGWEHRNFKPVKEIDFQNPDVSGLVRGGLVVGDSRGYELFSEGLTGSSLTRHIPSLGPKLQAYNDWLFNSYIPRLKVATGLHALERNRASYPKLGENELYHLTANQMNSAFGELNYEMLGRSKTTQDVLRLALLAPDFLEARSRFVAQAGTQYGREQFKALALGAATLYFTARIMNKVLDDEWHMERKNAFNIVHNGKAYSLRTVQGDLLHLATNPGQFLYTRLNPIYGRTAMEGLTGRDAFGRTRSRLEQVKDLGKTIVPISLRGVLNPREQNLWESFLNSIGITERRSASTDTIGKLAQDFNKARGKVEPGEFIYDPDKDPYRGVKLALRYQSPKEAAQEMAVAIREGKTDVEKLERFARNYGNRSFTGTQESDRKFYATLTADQKKIYADALEERKKMHGNAQVALSQYRQFLKQQTPVEEAAKTP